MEKGFLHFDPQLVDVITSYSIHYTKLYETAGRLFLEKNLQWGENSCGAATPDTGLPLNFRADPWYTAGFEGSFEEGRARFAAGILRNNFV